MSGALEYWSKHLRAIVVEGVLMKAYAEREGLSAARLYSWRSRLASEVRQGREARAVRVIAKPVVTLPINQFVPLELNGMASPSVRCTLMHGFGHASGADTVAACGVAHIARRSDKPRGALMHPRAVESGQSICAVRR